MSPIVTCDEEQIVSGLRLTCPVTDSPTPTMATPGPAPAEEKEPWAALFALLIGFFMILVDMTIVTVATPTIITDLHASQNSVIWVTSAYLLAYAVPVLITGRLGDRFGQRRLYLIGLAVFTLASLWCGLTGTIGALITARVVQGLGAAIMVPQTMATITRIFPPHSRGKAMGLWGATAGVSMVVGPVLGGILVNWLGWQWIFFINVPVGIFGLVFAARVVPALERHAHSFDWLGVVLSGVGMFLLVFAIQEGHQRHWSGTIIGMIVAGVVVLGLFLAWQRVNTREPLVPLRLFRDRNYSVSNVTITLMGFSIAGMGFPLMLYAEAVRGLEPVKAALLMLPMAIVTLPLARLVGRLTDRVHPRVLITFALACMSAAFFWLATQMHPSAAIWQLVLPMFLLGLGSAFFWAPNTATATRNLPMSQAGAGAGVYNTTRQVGAVLGSAAMAVLMDSRIAHFLPGAGAGNADAGATRITDPHVADLFSKAMSQAMLLPAILLVPAFAAAFLFERPNHAGFTAPRAVAVEPVAD